MIFVAESTTKHILGFIQWIHKSGFRKNVVMELEQLAVYPLQQSQGIASKLIEGSLLQIKENLAQNQMTLKSILVTTRADNHARYLYEKVLLAKVEVTIKNLYTFDEVIMVAHLA
ncbi:GNAT family N-acetyltransferase [Legionella pneumophila]|uniref:GNAT family N-acetyltransferase n=1 Tax=Legionella pneumophila TaxID=446 RepID=UPI000770970D|nr:GNAT family N-acetyltransferase [Legionella pneumophila]CZL27059.1 Uncharacterised protein [Legionella pneumophila]